jgi:hypothetical protein
VLHETDEPAGRRALPTALERLFDAIERDHAKTRSVGYYAKRRYVGMTPIAFRRSAQPSGRRN